MRFDFDVDRHTFAAIGNVCVDHTKDGSFAGGSALYSSFAAVKLGWAAVLVSNFGPDFRRLSRFPEGVRVICQNPSSTTTFSIAYDSNGKRRITLVRAGEKLTAEGLQEKLSNCDVLFLSPVADEYDEKVVKRLISQCRRALVVVTPQGWMRELAQGVPVLPKKWAAAERVLPKTDVLIVSEEDINNDYKLIDAYAELTGSQRGGKGVVVLTQGSKGATAYSGGKRLFSPAFKAAVIDPTGAGDVFAAAFSLKYYETKSLKEALVFANAAAAFVIEGRGHSNIAPREEVEKRIKSA